MPSEAGRFIQISLAEGRTAAAFAVHRQLDLKAESFEHRDGGDADLRLVIADKSIIPKNDFAALVAGIVDSCRVCLTNHLIKPFRTHNAAACVGPKARASSPAASASGANSSAAFASDRQRATEPA